MLREINVVNTPPRVSNPRVRGVTSTKTMSSTSPGQHTRLDCGAQGHGLVGVYVAARIFPKKLLDLFLYCRHPGHAAHQDHVVDAAGAETGIGDGLTAGLLGAANKVRHQLYQFGPGQGF